MILDRASSICLDAIRIHSQMFLTGLQRLVSLAPIATLITSILTRQTSDGLMRSLEEQDSPYNGRSLVRKVASNSSRSTV